MPPVREARPRVLVVDDELALAETLAEGLAARGYDAVPIDSGKSAAARLESEPFDALVTDLRMAGFDGFELLARSRALDPSRPVILMTAYGAIDSAVEAIRQGASHYLTKPFKLDELAIFLGRALDELRVRREAESLRNTLRERYSPKGMLGASKAMRQVFDVIERVADSDVPVLVLGETGTGKGLVATAIHAASPRASAPFVTVNCAALPEALLESELFGHVKGSFTGATAHREGLFAEAHGGTLFLDEIGEMSAALQAKLLHVIETGRYRPVGAGREEESNARIVAATHRDLREAVREGTFREDLLYRLDVVSIELPPLRRRSEDIPALVEQFFRAARARHPNSRVEQIGPDAMRRFMEYPWPGNVRELQHVVERAILLGRGPALGIDDLPSTLRDAPAPRAPTFGTEVLPMRELQRQYASWALEQLGGNRTRTAEKLDIDYKTLARLIAPERDEPPKS